MRTVAPSGVPLVPPTVSIALTTAVSAPSISLFITLPLSTLIAASSTIEVVSILAVGTSSVTVILKTLLALSPSLSFTIYVNTTSILFSPAALA